MMDERTSFRTHPLAHGGSPTTSTDRRGRSGDRERSTSWVWQRDEPSSAEPTDDPSRDEATEEPIRVLHVDDDPEFASVTADMLMRDDQITVVSESDPQRVIDRLRSSEESIDCIVSDFEMPDVNGMELFTAVRQVDDSVPFIIFTGSGEPPESFTTAGVTDAVPKGGPDQHRRLVDRIVAAVSRVSV